MSTLLYYHAEIYYQNGEYEQAKELYCQDFEVCQTIGWQRGLPGLPVVERNKDKRRIAHYKRSFAYLEQKRGNLDEARRWTVEALDGFERLSMYPEIEQMSALLGELKEKYARLAHIGKTMIIQWAKQCGRGERK